MTCRAAAGLLAIAFIASAHIRPPTAAAAGLMMPTALARLADSTAPQANAETEKKPRTAEERMRARFPQPVRVGDLIGLPLLDASHSTLGYVSQVVRRKDGRIDLIVAYGGLLERLVGDTRPIAVPIEVVGIRGRELASLDMPRAEYATAATWQGNDAAVLPLQESVLVALCRGY
jgi:hypothetical protein